MLYPFSLILKSLYDNDSLHYLVISSAAFQRAIFGLEENSCPLSFCHKALSHGSFHLLEEKKHEKYLETNHWFHALAISVESSNVHSIKQFLEEIYHISICRQWLLCFRFFSIFPMFYLIFLLITPIRFHKIHANLTVRERLLCLIVNDYSSLFYSSYDTSHRFASGSL